MGDSLPQLEAERSQILQQFTTLGDLRPGSICAVARRCGKPLLGAVEFLSHQSAIPGENGIGFGEARDLLQSFAT